MSKVKPNGIPVEIVSNEKINIKLTKLKEADNPLHPNNIEEGYETIREVYKYHFHLPEIGNRFHVGSFSTSAVQEIIGYNTFRTYNSIYKWEIIT